MDESVLDKIVRIKETLPKKQRILCNYIVMNYSKITMMTVAELAQQAEVGTTTVMRLMQLLDYESYARFRKALMKETIVRDSSSYSNMKQSLAAQSQGSTTPLAMLGEAAAAAAAGLLKNGNVEQFETMVQTLLEADTIYVLGFRSSYAVAQYFEDSVHLFMRKVVQLSNTQEFLYDNLLHMKENDVVLVISEWPCTKRTVVFAELCHRKNIPVVLVTNTSANPIVRYSSAMINTNSVGVQAGRLPSMLAVEALVQELGRRSQPQSIEMLSALETMLKEDGLVIWDQLL